MRECGQSVYAPQLRSCPFCHGSGPDNENISFMSLTDVVHQIDYGFIIVCDLCDGKVEARYEEDVVHLWNGTKPADEDEPRSECGQQTFAPCPADCDRSCSARMYTPPEIIRTSFWTMALFVAGFAIIACAATYGLSKVEQYETQEARI